MALEQLSLRSNAISHIALHTADLPYLTHLDLSDNTIASITVIKQARRLLRRVVVLDLSHNPITKDLYSKFVSFSLRNKAFSKMSARLESKQISIAVRLAK